MKTIKTYVNLVFVAVSLLFVAASAHAEYRLTIYPDAEGYKALNKSDPVGAIESFGNRRPARLDFLDLNNLCVSQIMVGELNDAITSCEASLSKIGRYHFVSAIEMREVEASVYSNLAVARAKSGDIAGARSDLETALSISFRDENAKANLEHISRNLVAEN